MFGLKKKSFVEMTSSKSPSFQIVFACNKAQSYDMILFWPCVMMLSFALRAHMSLVACHHLSASLKFLQSLNNVAYFI